VNLLGPENDNRSGGGTRRVLTQRRHLLMKGRNRAIGVQGGENVRLLTEAKILENWTP